MLKGEKMDNIATGKFIAQLRKEKGLTQEQLAQKLFISEKTISKWECGKGFPDTSLLMPLCEVLGITVNELLSAKHLEGKEIAKASEENLVSVLEEKQRNKKNLTLGFVFVAIAILAVFALFGITKFVPMSTGLQIAIIVIGFVLLCFVIGVGCVVDKNVGYFECPHCKTRFKPSTFQYVMGVHSATTRRLTCPHCKKRSFCKKRLSK